MNPSVASQPNQRPRSEAALSVYIRKCQSDYLDARQIHKRMKDLLPDKLKSIKAKYRSENSSARSERLGLMDPDHLKFIKELSLVYKRWIESKIAYEVAVIQRHSIRSSRSARRPKERKR